MTKLFTKAENYLILVAAFWGITFPLLHQAVQYIPPAHLVFWRFLVATFIIFPFVLHSLKHTTIFLLFGSMVLGILNLGTYLCQTTALETISASRTAFLTGANVLFIPFLSPLFGLGYPKFIHFVSSMICLFGLYILTGANLSALTIGDFWGISCATFVTLTILTIQRLTKRIQHYLLMTFYQVLFTSLFSMMIISNKLVIAGWNSVVIFVIIFCSLFATVIALFIQLRFQHHTTALKAALIFSLEPVFANVFDALLNREIVSPLTLTGGFLILLSILTPEIDSFFRLRIHNEID